MSGEQQRNDDPDFLDDDFVIEDLAGKGDDLDQLFQPSADAPKPMAKPPGSAPDEDDVLFHDHSQNVKPSERFQGREAFAEDAKSSWRGEELELDQANANEAEAQAAELAAAEQSFTEELGSMLQSEEEFGLDSEKELELVDAPTGGDVEEPVVASADPIEQAHAEVVAEALAEEPTLAEDAPVEPGWEPLPETSVDQLSEVGDVQPVDEGEVQPTPEELAEMDGHDLYDADAEAQPVLVGPRAKAAGRTLRLVAALAASLALVGGAAVVVLRPEWVGLALEPVRVDVVKLERPRVSVAIATPPALPTAPQLGHADPVPTPTTTPDPLATGPVYGPEPPPEWSTPETSPSPSPGTGPIAGVPAPNGSVFPTTPAATSPVADWPVVAPPKVETGRTPKAAPLVRVGDNVMLGDVVPGAGRPGRAVEGVAPGARAFAQLHNGNYFIGSVKNAADDRVTLRVADGEVTLPAEEIARLTQLGTADYDELQRVTSGSIRLRNNNRLVGGILSQIADDHVVLEFRSNRVMLPKSVIGEVKAGADEEVRLDVTREEDDWVRSLAERELGTGTGSATVAPDATKSPAATPKTTPAPKPAPKAAPKPTPTNDAATPPATPAATPAAPPAGSPR